MSKKNYTVPGHGTRIKHAVVENPKSVKGLIADNVPGSSPVAPIPANNTIQGVGVKPTKPGKG